MPNPHTITYTDELLVDHSLHRRYSNGVEEWRQLLPDGRVEWLDSSGQTGKDELLGEGIIKRSYADGQVIYAREQGYGRTVWGDGTLVTINKTSFGGQVGAILTLIGAGALLGPLFLPPSNLTSEAEATLRQWAGVASPGQRLAAEDKVLVDLFEAGRNDPDAILTDIEIGDQKCFD